MIFLNLDELFIDRVGHAAGVFGYALPKGVAFGLEQLVAGRRQHRDGLPHSLRTPV